MQWFGNKDAKKTKAKAKRKRLLRAASRSELHRKRSGNPAAIKRIRSMQRRKRRNKGGKRLLTVDNLSFAFTTFLTLLIMGLLTLAYFMHDLPDISTLTQVRKAPSIVLRTQSGQIIGSSGDIYGEYIRYNNIPADLVKAVVATEDRQFFQHFGIDPLGLLRAAVANFRAGRIVQGGSTITQQLAKNVFLTPERSLKRKVQEVILALWMERRYSKQEIMTVYLNRVYFGAGTYGVDAAARRYFNKSARDLYLPESAMVAGLLKAPSRYAPTSDAELAKGRATQVLMNMVDAGLLNDGQLEAARKAYAKMSFPDIATSNDRRYFADWILEQIPDYVGNIETDLIVTTTFDPSAQAHAEKAIDNVMDQATITKFRAGQAALVSMTPEGAVRAMIGGLDYGNSQFNRATQAKRQPGSAFKLFVYLAALENGFQPYSFIEDSPITVANWTPGNYDGKYAGLVSVRTALEKSINTVSVRLSETIGRQKVIDMAHRLGLKAKMQAVPSIALGVTETTLLEMTNAFAHLAADGRIVLPYGIESIQDTYGKIIYKRSTSSLGRVLQPAIVAKMNDLLLAVVEEGTGRGASIGRPAAGKTGTSQDFRDGWFIGFTPELVTGVWVGNDNNTPMKKVSGGNLPARIWAQYMKPALANLPVRSIRREKYPDEIWMPIGENGQREAGTGQVPAKEKESLGQSFWDALFSLDDEGTDPPPRRPRIIR